MEYFEYLIQFFKEYRILHLNPTFIDTYLEKYQNPHEVDPLMKVQRELDETKILLVSLPQHSSNVGLLRIVE